MKKTQQNKILKQPKIYYIRSDNSYELRDCNGKLLSMSESNRRKGFYKANDERYGEKLAFGLRNEAGEHVIEIKYEERMRSWWKQKILTKIEKAYLF